MANTASNPYADIAKAHVEHKADETKVGSGGDLPADIEHGVAELSDVKISTYQKGNYQGHPFFMAAGIVLDPESVVTTDPASKKQRTIKVKGLRTQIGPLPICDTTNASGEVTPLSEHWSRVLNHLRLLGIDTKTTEPTDIISQNGDKWESGTVLAALKEAAVCFSFRTWQGRATEKYPNPRVNHEWRGLTERPETNPEAEIVDETATEPEPEETGAYSDPEPETVPVQEEPETVQEREPDLIDLAEIADNKGEGHEQAANTIATKAQELGVDYESAENWLEEVEAMIRVSSTPEEAPAEPEPEAPEESYESYDEGPWEPVPGEIGFFNPPKSTEKVQCEFLEIDDGKVKLKRTSDSKVFGGVPVSKVFADNA